MNETPVVTCFLRNAGDVLLLRRSEAVGSYPGLWGGVAGHVADDQGRDRSPDAAAMAEIEEETGLDSGAVSRVRADGPFPVAHEDRGDRWLVHPFLFDCESRAVETNEETVEHEWVPPTAILRRETVPALWTSYDCVRPRVSTVREDHEHGSAHLSLRALEVLRDEAALAVEDRPAREEESRVTSGNDWDALATVARELLDARPSMAVVANRVNRVMSDASDHRTPADSLRSTPEPWRAERARTPTDSRCSSAEHGLTQFDRTPAAVESAANDGIERALSADGEAAANAAERLPDRLATLSRSGTVLAALREASPDAVLVAESRPGREGVDVAESLAPDCEVTLTTDAAFPFELDDWDADALVVGADRVLPDGRLVNKVGTRGALLAAPAGCDCVVVAASDKVATEESVALEERDAAEVYDGDASLAVANPTFDVTPADAVDAVVTEEGVLDADEVARVAAAHRRRTDWD